MKRNLLVVSVTLVLVAGACSGDRGADESGSVDDPSSSTTVAGADGATFGTLASPCSAGDGTTPADGTGDDAQGIEADRILVGTVSDPGFTGRPGLNQELFDAGQAFVAWCNDQGASTVARSS